MKKGILCLTITMLLFITSCSDLVYTKEYKVVSAEVTMFKDLKLPFKEVLITKGSIFKIHSPSMEFEGQRYLEAEVSQLGTESTPNEGEEYVEIGNKYFISETALQKDCSLKKFKISPGNRGK